MRCGEQREMFVLKKECVAQMFSRARAQWEGVEYCLFSPLSSRATEVGRTLK